MTERKGDVKLDEETYGLLVKIAEVMRDRWPVQSMRRLIWTEGEMMGLVESRIPKKKEKGNGKR